VQWVNQFNFFKLIKSNFMLLSTTTENTGMVTFNDLYVFREEKTASSYTSFANTITHELSHHWFGNLVTMKWWNDLWLNESFADFISHYIISKMNVKSKPMIDIWVEFNMRKSWG